ncbi:hypothetical protein GHK47_06010 [Sinorhizobium meliloti]|nr:hypothetical protein [Sinorhizobium meliloti]
MDNEDRNIGNRWVSCARGRLQRRRFHFRCRPARTDSRGRDQVLTSSGRRPPAQ